jgi:protein transport protein SEC24
LAHQQPHLAQQQQYGQQPMNQSQQFRPQAPAQPAPRPRIDPDQIPSPVAVQEADQEEWDHKPFVTSLRTSPTPLASSDFMAIDGGRYHRSLTCVFTLTCRNPTWECLTITMYLFLNIIRQLQSSILQDDDLQPP